jgi:hypothetical protein
VKKSDIIKLVQDSGADKELKTMVIGYIDLAYKAGSEDGFAEGTRVGGQITSSMFDLLLNSGKK